MPPRIFLSTPHLGQEEFELLRQAFADNWIALGPDEEAFEHEFEARIGSPHAVAASSGTAALHLAMRILGLQRDDEVFCSTFSYIASANPIAYEGARPVFIDSEQQSWNMDPARLAEALAKRAKKKRLPRAVILVHVYGQSADIAPIAAACAEYDVPLIENAAEALGAVYHGGVEGRAQSPGTVGRMGIFSFNGNKIITTAGGGMLISADETVIRRAKYLAALARDPAPHHQHSEVGFNYRMSNVQACIGRGQLRVLTERVNARRANFDYYSRCLGGLPGISFMPEAPWNRATRWLTCIRVNAVGFGMDRETLRRSLAAENIEARPVWKPLHQQPAFDGCEVFGGAVAEGIFAEGLCLPSGSHLTQGERDRVVAVIRKCAPA